MTSKHLSDPSFGGGLKPFKNNPTKLDCNLPNRPYLKAEDFGTKTVYFIRPDCKTWACPACGERRARMWRYLAAYGGDYLLSAGLGLSFVTLTSHRFNRTPLAGIVVWRKAWPKLSARWRRKAIGLQYLYVGEVSKLGRFHIHIITSAGLPTRWYKDNAAETGLGYMAKAIPIETGLECGHYVTKYLTKAVKDGGWPKYWRRVNTSRRWPKPKDAPSPYEWTNMGNHEGRILGAMEAYQYHGWTVSQSLF